MSVSYDSSNIIWSIVDDEAVLLDTSSGHYFSLNPIATKIWKHLNDGDSVSQIVEKIAGRYAVGEEIVQGDVNELVAELCAAGLWEQPLGSVRHD